MMNSELELLKNALLENKLLEFMTGKDKYYFVEPLAEMPTNVGLVEDTIKKYFEEHDACIIWKEYEKALIKMCDDPTNVWLCLYYFMGYLYYREFKKQDFIDFEYMKEQLINSLKKYRYELIYNKSWVGYKWPDGLWGDVKRMIRNINNEFNIGLVVE
jgi:hypothetical protein